MKKIFKGTIMAQTIEKIMQYPSITDEYVKMAIDDATKIIKEILPDYTNKFPANSSKDGFYPKTDNCDWTNGFWTGENWLSYELTGDEDYREAAEVQVQSFLHRIINKIGTNNHDMGFLFSLSCVAAYKLTGNEDGKKAAILAADNLANRYREVGNFLQAWGTPGDPAEYRLIIDCLLNLPLLYWATEVTGDKTYAQKAENHIKTAMRCVVRDDNSTYHTHFIDMVTGEPTHGVTHQGNRNDSAWSRGQAWGIYGVALSYIYLQKDEYIDIFRRVTDYFIEHLPEDLIPYWDFDFDDGSDQPRDSSASAIAICGMLEMSKYLEKEEAEKYTHIAYRLLRALIDHCANKDTTKANGLLLHGVYGKASPYNDCTDRGVDECNTWGDYFYLEALTRLTKDWELYW